MLHRGGGAAAAIGVTSASHSTPPAPAACEVTTMAAVTICR